MKTLAGRRVGLVSAVLLLGACSSTGTPGEAPADTVTGGESLPERISVTVAPPERRELTEEITLAGTIVPEEQVTLYAKVTGYLKSISVDIGDHVEQGQLLAEIDVPEMVASLEEKRAGLVRAEAQVHQAKASVGQYEAELEFKKTQHKRLSAIRERDPDVLPQQEVDQARAALGVAESKLRTAQADVQAREAAVSAAEAAMATLTRLSEYTRIVAPMRGVVTERFVDPGALVQAAASSRTQVAPLVSLARVDRVRVVVAAPEPATPHVRRGTEAAVEVEGYPGEPFEATVSRIGAVLDPATHTMRVEIDLPNRGRRLRPGMSAAVTLVLRRIEDALTVPAAAVQSSGEGTSLFVVADAKARRRAVSIGMESAGSLQIVEGLTGGEQVVVSSAAPLTEGAGVAVHP